MTSDLIVLGMGWARMRAVDGRRRGGKAPARTQPHETVYFPVHGVFGWDGALIAFAYQWAREAGVGTELDL